MPCEQYSGLLNITHHTVIALPGLRPDVCKVIAAPELVLTSEDEEPDTIEPSENWRTGPASLCEAANTGEITESIIRIVITLAHFILRII